MKLYSYWRSSSAWRVRIALNLKNLDYQIVPIDLTPGTDQQKSAEFAAVHPAAQVPVLVFDDASPLGKGKSIALSQSVAIIELLDDLHPEPRLFPDDAMARARVREVVEIINSGIQPLQNLGMFRAIEQWTSTAQARAFVGDKISTSLTRFRQLLPEGNGPFCFGDTLSAADVFLVPQLYAARRFAADLSSLGKLLRVERECEQLPAFQRAHPDAQPDAPSK